MEEKLWKTYSRSFVCLDINILSSVSITLPVPHGKVLLQDLVFRLSEMPTDRSFITVHSQPAIWTKALSAQVQ